ncbi:MAG: hypothetical protein IT285_05025 [Bdellovibrionales bacterium]|nr:hypothetical protein [Bdellovibrionales bacterium]
MTQIRVAAAFIIVSSMFSTGMAAKAVEYDRVKNEIGRIIAENPTIATGFELGVNDQGEAILGIRFEAAQPSTSPRVSQLLVGTHHGNERLSADVSLSFARRMVGALKNPSAPESAGLVDQVMYVVPVLNIGGFNLNRRYENNAAGATVDPNRDYPDPCLAEKANFQLKSTRALADFLVRENITASVTVHGYIGTFTYPWGIFTADTHTPDHAAYDVIGRRAVAANGYRTGTHTDLIYGTAGAYEDFAYHDHGVWTMLLELAHSPNLARDTTALATFFQLAPRARSESHTHNVSNCTGDSRNLDMLLSERP